MTEPVIDLDLNQEHMQTRKKRKPLWTRDKSKPTFSESGPQLERLRSLSQWLLIIPVVMLTLFSCGQIGILTSRKIAGANTQSNMEASYKPWSYVLIHSVKPEIIEEILQDKRDEEGEDRRVTEKDESDEPWLPKTLSPTSIAYLEPTSTLTPIHDEDQILPTETVLPQTTPTQAPVSSPTPTLNQPGPTNTPSPIPTIAFSPTNVPAPSDTPTNTPAISISNTYWFSSDRVLNGYALSPDQPNGPSTEGTIQLRYFTEPMPEGATIEGGKCNLSFYASNSSDQKWEIGFVVSAGTSGWPTLGGTTKAIPANTTTPTLFTKNFTILPHTFSQGERLTFTISLSRFVTIYWDGEWNDAGLVVPPITP